MRSLVVIMSCLKKSDDRYIPPALCLQGSVYLLFLDGSHLASLSLGGVRLAGGVVQLLIMARNDERPGFAVRPRRREDHQATALQER